MEDQGVRIPFKSCINNNRTTKQTNENSTYGNVNPRTVFSTELWICILIIAFFVLFFSENSWNSNLLLSAIKLYNYGNPKTAYLDAILATNVSTKSGLVDTNSTTNIQRETHTTMTLGLTWKVIEPGPLTINKILQLSAISFPSPCLRRFKTATLTVCVQIRYFYLVPAPIPLAQ